MATLGRPAKGAAAFLAALSLVAAIPSVPALGAQNTSCRVTNTTPAPDTTFSTLADAVAAASSDDDLTVRGICHGVTVIDKNLTISGVRPRGYAAPTLDGDELGTVVTVNASTIVTIESLKVTGGKTGGNGGGILDNGTLTLRDVAVRGNSAAFGGGIYVESATLTLDGRTSVDRNTADADGGGIKVHEAVSSLTLNGRSSVHHNTAAGLGGGIMNEAGSVSLHDTATIHHNRSNETFFYGGGGIFNDFLGVVLLDGRSSVHHNTAASGHAPAIYVRGSLILRGHASVHHNTSGTVVGSFQSAGAIELAAYGAQTTSFTMEGTSSVRYNKGGPGGGGIVAWQGCGSTAPTLTGATTRTKKNKPNQIVAATGCPFG